MIRFTTNLGSFDLELDAKAAPKTVANFERYVKEGFYNGTLFHRVIDGFMIQGGGFEAGMQHKEGHAPIENEAINHTVPSGQGWGYAVFGRVVKGFDVIDRIAKVKTGSSRGFQDVPKEDVVIEKAEII